MGRLRRGSAAPVRPASSAWHGLLVRVGPVEDGIPGKLVVRQCLEGRAGQMQRELAADAVKGKVGLVECPRPHGGLRH